MTVSSFKSVVQGHTNSTMNGVGFVKAIVALKLNPLTGGFMRLSFVMLKAPCEFTKSVEAKLEPIRD